MPKLKVNAWIEDDSTEKSNIPIECPRCHGKISKTDASRECGLIVVWCPYYLCRWMEIYEV